MVAIDFETMMVMNNKTLNESWDTLQQIIFNRWILEYHSKSIERATPNPMTGHQMVSLCYITRLFQLYRMWTKRHSRHLQVTSNSLRNHHITICNETRVTSHTPAVLCCKNCDIVVSRFSLSFPTEGCPNYKKLTLRGHIRVHWCTLHYSAHVFSRVWSTCHYRIKTDGRSCCYKVDEGIGYVNLTGCDLHVCSRHEGKLKPYATSLLCFSLVNQILGKALQQDNIVKHAKSDKH